MRFKKPRFDLFSLMEWTAAIAFLFALVAGGGGNVHWRYDFPSLPANDSALHEWLADQGRKDIRVTRDADSIVLETDSGFFSLLSGLDQLPRPPWNLIDYPQPTGSGGGFHFTFLRGPWSLWLSGFGILFLLGYLRRRFAVKSGEVSS